MVGFCSPGKAETGDLTVSSGDLARFREVLGTDCALSDEELVRLVEELWALAEIAYRVYSATRRVPERQARTWHAGPNVN